MDGDMDGDMDMDGESINKSQVITSHFDVHRQVQHIPWILWSHGKDPVEPCRASTVKSPSPGQALTHSLPLDTSTEVGEQMNSAGGTGTEWQWEPGGNQVGTRWES